MLRPGHAARQNLGMGSEPMDWLTGVDSHWLWLVAGLLLLTGELLAPGVYLMWFGLAALVTGIAAAVLPIGLTTQMVLFAVVAVAAVYRARRMVSDHPIETDDPLLNDRSARLIGHVVEVLEPIRDGVGRVRVGDSVWTAQGPDVEAGTKMRVSGVIDGVLTVEPISSPPRPMLEG